jgi:hypothetical protein
MPLTGVQLSETLNRDCYCIAVDGQALRAKLGAHLEDAPLADQLIDVQGNLFADSPVFLSQQHIHQMAELIRAVEEVVSNPAYRSSVLADAPVPIRQDFGPKGIFFSYDFHLGENGPQLIEINTNAGGVLLSLYQATAQQACCGDVTTFFGGKTEFADAEADLIAMFEQEWRLQRPDNTLHTIAIVDSNPSAQFLYPEFLLFQKLFERHGIEAIVADPEDLAVRENALWVGAKRIDLVYNRLTDFYLETAESAHLREAYRNDLAVVTPSPLNYALYADKRNLPIFSDSRRLNEFAVSDDAICALNQFLPTTVAVTTENADRLWKDRKRLFFKPATGYGSRGAYRGAKLTRRVWKSITQADYIAQNVVPPSERQLVVDGEKRSLKVDLRCITYAGKIQQLSARLYQGQTTNLRTEGGGLATVFTA